MTRSFSTLLLVAAVFAGSFAARPARVFAQTDLDALMERVLAHRDENWKKLQQYILDEAERIDVHGPASLPVWGERREYSWFIRDGFFIRSPLKVNGVTVPEADRRKAEDRYLKLAQERDKRTRAQAVAAKPPAGSAPAAAAAPEPAEPKDLEALILQSRQPEFMDSAYFLRFKFEQGTYAFVGRETFDGLDVLKIEYYPAHLFRDAANKVQRQQKDGTPTRDAQVDAKLEQMMNKISLVTLWIEPKAGQIVKYTFDNVNMDFLPAAWLMRVRDMKASMTMSQPFKDTWLPQAVDFFASATIAVGSFDARYHIDYRNYREASTNMRIKIKDPAREP